MMSYVDNQMNVHKGDFSHTHAENQKGPFKPGVEQLLVVDSFWGGAESACFIPMSIWITQMERV